MTKISKEKKKEYNQKYREKMRSLKEQEKKEVKVKVKEEVQKVKEEDSEEEHEFTEEEFNKIVEIRVQQALLEKEKKVVTAPTNKPQNNFFLNLVKQSTQTLIETGTMMLIPLALKTGMSYWSTAKMPSIPFPQASKTNSMTPQTQPQTTSASPLSMPLNEISTGQQLPPYIGC